MKTNGILKILLVSILVLNFAGCTFIIQRGRRSDLNRIDELSQQLDELTQAKRLLEDRLKGEIKDNQVKLEMMAKGLVLTFVADIIFDSGKAKIKQDAYSILDKVAKVLKENVPGLNIGIEGHTDNVPIKHSGWKSNWELSTSRALSVLHYLVDDKGLAPERVSAIGYGEYKPVASNDTAEGRKSNRRVEIVILPQIKEKGAKQPLIKKSGLKEPEENLK